MQHPDAAFLQAISKHSNLVFCIKGSPDPDALAAAFVCAALAERLGKKCRIVATQALSLHQNRVFAKRLSLPFELTHDFARLADWGDAYLVLDHASAVVEGLSDRLPCVVHIDHHDAVEASFPIAMRWCRTDVGSTCTLVAHILEACHDAFSISSRDMRRMTTALSFGLQTDTDQCRLATPTDYAAIKFLSRFADTALLKQLSGIPMGRTTTNRLQRAERNQIIYKNCLFAGVGFIPVRSRDDIAIIADLLLRRQQVALVAVFALVQDESRKKLTLDASVRSADRGLRLSTLIRRIASDGGGRRFKGAFQVKLDYFLTYSDREALWAFVEKVTVEKLKQTRDSHYKVRLQGLLESAEETAAKFLAGLPGGMRVVIEAFMARRRQE